MATRVRHASTVRTARWGALIGLVLSWASAAGADIVGTTSVELYRNGTLVRASSSPHLYRPTGEHRMVTTKVESSVWEGLIDAAQLGGNLAALIDGNLVAGIGAYDEFRQMLTSWGGRSGWGEGAMNVLHPHAQYNRVKIIFEATSDDDDILRPHSAPGNLPEAGIRLTTTVATVRRWKYVYDIDLAALSRYLAARNRAYGSFPFAFGFREDAAVTTLKCAQAFTLRFRRVEEAPPTMTTTARYYPTATASGTPTHHALQMSFAPRVSAAQPGWGEAFDHTVIDVVRDPFGRCRIAGRPFTLLRLDFLLESNRVLYGTTAPYRLQVHTGGPTSGWHTWGSQLVPRPGTQRDSAGRSYRTEGTCASWAELETARMAPGRYTYTFLVTDRNGNAICQQVVHVRVANGAWIVNGTNAQ